MDPPSICANAHIPIIGEIVSNIRKCLMTWSMVHFPPAARTAATIDSTFARRKAQQQQEWELLGPPQQQQPHTSQAQGQGITSQEHQQQRQQNRPMDDMQGHLATRE
jgi:hypothetical protein